MLNFPLGTITIASGEDTATIVGGSLLQIPIGSSLLIEVSGNIRLAVVKDRDETTVTLAEDWPHASVTEAAYSVVPSQLGVNKAVEALVEAIDYIQGGVFPNGARLFGDGTEHLRVDGDGLFMQGPLSGPAIADLYDPNVSPASALLQRGTFFPETLTNGDNTVGEPIFDSEENIIGRNLLPDWRVYRVDSSNPPPGLPVDFTGTGTLVVKTTSASLQTQILMRHSATAANSQMWFRVTVSSQTDGVVGSPWARVFTSNNVLGQITMISNNLTGGIIETGGTSVNNFYVRLANGWQTVRMLLDVDITNTSSSQQYSYPASFFSSAAVAVSHAALSPNPALYFNNIRAVGFGSFAAIRLTTAGTGANPGENTDQLRITAQGFAAGMNPF